MMWLKASFLAVGFASALVVAPAYAANAEADAAMAVVWAYPS